ncbi:MAG: hypothetical protein NTZ48_05175, partial [Candidatus Omnitrophica bacterium]|nr:hypothetical protein [Candidatus Omnitrophota bacterium]
ATAATVANSVTPTEPATTTTTPAVPATEANQPVTTEPATTATVANSVTPTEPATTTTTPAVPATEANQPVTTEPDITAKGISDYVNVGYGYIKGFQGDNIQTAGYPRKANLFDLTKGIEAELRGYVWDSEDSNPELRGKILESLLSLLIKNESLKQGENETGTTEISVNSELIRKVILEEFTLEDIEALDNLFDRLTGFEIIFDSGNLSQEQIDETVENFMTDLENGDPEVIIEKAATILNSDRVDESDKKVIINLLEENGQSVRIGNIVVIFDKEIIKKIKEGNFDLDKFVSEITAVLKNLKSGNKITAFALVFGNVAGFSGSFLNVLSFIGFIPGLDFNLEDFLKKLIKSIIEGKPIAKAPIKNLPSPMTTSVYYLQYGLLALVFVILNKKARKVSLDAIYAATLAGVKKENEPLKILINVKLPQKSPELTIYGSRLEKRVSARGRLTADVARLVPKQKFILNSSELEKLDADTDKRLNQLKYWANYISNMNQDKK